MTADGQEGQRLRALMPRVDGFLPLRGYAVLGDQRSCALLGEDGAIDWWALPTMADAPCFGAVLDPERGGSFVLRPVGDFRLHRSYVDGGGVLRTVYRGDGGTVQVTEALTWGIVALLPWTELARRVDVLDGAVEMRWEVVPGTQFERTQPWQRLDDGTARITVGDQELALICHRVGDAEQVPGGFCGRFTARPGAPAVLAVIATDGEPVPVPAVDAILARLDDTIRRWSQWTGQISYHGPWSSAVRRSALVHKQLTLQPGGGVQAAATTSLPEKVGGSRNFDYRFCWVRDTGFALDALTGLGLAEEVHAALSFILDAVSKTAPDIKVFYPMRGGQPSAQMASVPLWRGYRGSAPVQLGNQAAAQQQLGTYGDLLEAVARYVRHGNRLDPGTGRVIYQLAQRVCEQWTQDDAGLWELGQQRPYTISKIGCWVALDRAVELAGLGQVPDDHVERWQGTAEQIRDYVNRACWSPTGNSYTFYAGTDDLDCATLLAARTRFCAGDDPRLHATIDAIRGELSAGGPKLYRYSGMQDEEGAFLACTFWLVEALAIAGRLDEARDTMDAAVALTNDVGLLTEEIDPSTDDLVGNMPQALSHLALISAATTYQAQLSRAEHG